MRIPIKLEHNQIQDLVEICNEYKPQVDLYDKSNKDYYVNAKNYIALTDWFDKSPHDNLILDFHSNSVIESLDFEKQVKIFK